MKDDVLSDLVDLLYGAATEAKRWPDFLGRLAHATDSASTLLMARDAANPCDDLLWHFGPDEAARAWGEWAEANIVMRAAAPPPRTGAVLPDRPAARGDDRRSASYDESTSRRVNLADTRGICVFHESPPPTVLGCNRPTPDYGPREQTLLQELSPHLPRAISIHRRLGRAELEQASSEAALDTLAYGVLFVDERGRVLLYNRAARAILDDADGLSLSARGELRTEHSADQNDAAPPGGRSVR